MPQNITHRDAMRFSGKLFGTRRMGGTVLGFTVQWSDAAPRCQTRRRDKRLNNNIL